MHTVLRMLKVAAMLTIIFPVIRASAATQAPAADGQLPPPAAGRGHVIGTMLCPEGPRAYVPVWLHRLVPTDRSKFDTQTETGGTDANGRWQALNIEPGDYIVRTYAMALPDTYTGTEVRTVKAGTVNDLSVLKDPGGDVLGGCGKAPATVYVQTPPEVVAAMLKLAGVTKDDVLYDLGSGDGRIVIAAARDFGSRGVGIEILPKLVREAQENAQKAGVADRVRFIEQDLFRSDISEATVVALYLIPSVNRRLQPKLLGELKPGTRVISHAFLMREDWPPERESEIGGRKIFLWTIPRR